MNLKRLNPVFLALAAALSASAGRAAESPNIVFILIDDMGYADPGCFGSDFHDTPNIDRLAQRGMKFTDGYAACPVCSPTRASILSGKYPARLKLTNFIAGRREIGNARVLPADFKLQMELEEVTLAEALESSGYASCHVGKWHLGDEPYSPEHQGFDVNIGGCGAGMPRSYFYPEWTANLPIPDGTPGEYLTDRLSAEACKFIERNKDRPFFLYLAHYAVHIPIQAKEAIIEKYRAKAAARPGARQNNPIYAAMVESVDQGVGQVMDTLGRLGLAGKTVVFFFSDNGGLRTPEGPHTPATNNWPLRDGKGYLYEGGIREPMIVVWPGVVEPGSVCSVPVSSVDFYPTILEMTRTAGNPAHVPDGVSLVPLLKRNGGIGREAVYWHYPHFSNQGGMPGGAVRQGRYKLIRFYNDDSIELYDLEQDLGEKNNLARRLPEKTAELNKLLDDWLRSVDATPCPPNPAYDPSKPLGRPFSPGSKVAPKK
jgi:arylsulfatase A-like enzyme